MNEQDYEKVGKLLRLKKNLGTRIQDLKECINHNEKISMVGFANSPAIFFGSDILSQEDNNKMYTMMLNALSKKLTETTQQLAALGVK